MAEFNLFPDNDKHKPEGDPEKFSQWDEDAVFDANAFEKLAGDEEVCPDCGMTRAEALEHFKHGVASEYEDITTDALRAVINKIIWDIVVVGVLRPTPATLGAVLSSVIEEVAGEVQRSGNGEFKDLENHPAELKAANDGINAGFRAAVDRFKLMYSKTTISDEFLEKAVKALKKSLLD